SKDSNLLALASRAFSRPASASSPDERRNGTRSFALPLNCISDRQCSMRFIGSLIDKLQRHPKRVVFPEGTEPRVLQAARQFYSLRLGVPILLGDRSKVKETA